MKYFNLPTTLTLVLILAAIVAAVLSSPINWLAIIWMFIAGMWASDARCNHMTAEDYRRLYNDQAKKDGQLLFVVESLKNEQAETADKYQALDNEYLKLASLHEETLREPDEAQKTIAALNKQLLLATPDDQPKTKGARKRKAD